MYEVEVKVPADLETVRTRLEAIGDGAVGNGEAATIATVTPQGTVVQRDTYYDAPHRSFPETDEALRIRTEQPADGAEETRITYKGPLIDDESKSREEVETGVADGEKMDAVLTNLGFDAAATVRKERERFTLDVEPPGYEYTITLDTVADVGEFVEVETEIDSEDDLESAREGAYDVLDVLGLDPNEQIRTSYLGLLLES